MYNVGFQTMNNLVLPRGDKVQKEKSNSLLSRNVPQNNNSKPKEVKNRIASYVSEIRKARMELNNG
tara:strand:+ start:398 stop:595 length:198 start_codon:yes stop_codon:yes gene_type:complete